MLKHINKTIQRCFAVEKRLFVYDPEDYKAVRPQSGIRATIFGASGLMGKPIGGLLGSLGSHITYPLSLSHNYLHSQHLKELKVTGAVNKSWTQWDMNYKNVEMIQRMVKNSNVVINLLGPRKKIKKREDFEFINIQVPERIAHACKKYGVHRLIHFSAAGANVNSESLDFQTKALGEQVVKKAFPNATIFRPCPIYGFNDYFASNIQRQFYFFWNHLVLVYDDCSAKKQPIKDCDVARCVLNALKLQQTKGKTYELGGPNVLSMLQVHQIMFNITKFKPRLAYVNRQFALRVAQKVYNFQFFGKQYIIKKSIDQVVKPQQYGTVTDLKVEPVTFKNGVFDVVREFVLKTHEKTQDNQN